VNRRGRLVALLLCSACFLACDPSDPCDPGYYADHGACLLPSPRRDGSGDAGTDDAGPQPFNEKDFGYACATDADCGGSAPSCGAPQLPVCTAINCLGGAVRCPSTWNCLDVSAWTPDPAIQSVCVNF
jgi:hypothetical protein